MARNVFSLMHVCAQILFNLSYKYMFESDIKKRKSKYLLIILRCEIEFLFLSNYIAGIIASSFLSHALQSLFNNLLLMKFNNRLFAHYFKKNT
jgi:hypothetical protein